VPSGFHIRADIATIHEHRPESPTQLTLVPKSAPDPQKVRLSWFQIGIGCRSRFVTRLSTTLPAQITNSARPTPYGPVSAERHLRVRSKHRGEISSSCCSLVGPRRGTLVCAVSSLYIGMALRRTIVVAFAALVLAACSSGGAASTTVTGGERGATLSTTTQPAPSSTTSTMQPTTTITVSWTLSESGQPGFEGALGTAERACVDVDQIVASEEPKMVGPEDNRVPVFDIRSGEILAGNFASVVNKWSEWPGGEVKIYWVPFDYRVVSAAPLEVTVQPLDSDDPATEQTLEVRASTASAVFWPSGTKFPEPGRYRLTATAPGHWGCFELTV
jgi:hypothetical protein